MDIFSLMVGFLAASLLLVVGFYLLYSRYLERYSRLHAYAHQLQQHMEEGREREEQLKNRLLVAEEKSAFLERKSDQLKEQFEHIALDVLSRKSQDLTQNQHAHLKRLLEPFSENIHAFQQKIEQFYQAENRERFSLAKEIQALRALNERISQDAINLTNALKGDNKLQGNWGEMILEKVLESSGLTKGREYVTQKSFQDSEGRVQRPDVIIHLPGEKDIVIDAKVSLKAYEAYVSADEDEIRSRELAAHLDSLKMHISTLSKKDYHMLKQIRSLDFVLLFIPVEAAFLAALEADPQLYEKAYRQNIILVSPTTLLAVLRTIEHAWRYEHQNKNAHRIAKKAGDLYEKFVLFVESMQQVDTALQKAQEAYDTAYKRLSSGKGNLIDRAEELREMEGISARKEKRLPRS